MFCCGCLACTISVLRSGRCLHAFVSLKKYACVLIILGWVYDYCVHLLHIVSSVFFFLTEERSVTGCSRAVIGASHPSQCKIFFVASVLQEGTQHLSVGDFTANKKEGTLFAARFLFFLPDKAFLVQLTVSLFFFFFRFSLLE